MIRCERSNDELIEVLARQFISTGEIHGLIRLKWLMHDELSIQLDQDEITLRAIREKNKTF